MNLKKNHLFDDETDTCIDCGVDLQGESLPCVKQEESGEGRTPGNWRVDWLDDKFGWILAPNPRGNGQGLPSRKGLPFYIAEIVTEDSAGLVASPAQQKANGDYIVKAVNHHDEMRLMLQECLEYLTEAHSEAHPASCEDCRYCSTINRIKGLFEKLNKKGR